MRLRETLWPTIPPKPHYADRAAAYSRRAIVCAAFAVAWGTASILLSFLSGSL